MRTQLRHDRRRVAVAGVDNRRPADESPSLLTGAKRTCRPDRCSAGSPAPRAVAVSSINFGAIPSTQQLLASMLEGTEDHALSRAQDCPVRLFTPLKRALVSLGSPQRLSYDWAGAFHPAHSPRSGSVPHRAIERLFSTLPPRPDQRERGQPDAIARAVPNQCRAADTLPVDQERTATCPANDLPDAAPWRSYAVFDLGDPAFARHRYTHETALTRR